MKKTLADFKQEIAEKYNVHINYLFAYQTDEAAELYTEYKAKEEFIKGYKEGHAESHKNEQEVYVHGWNAALNWAAEEAEVDMIDYDYAIVDKQSILKGLK